MEGGILLAWLPAVDLAGVIYHDSFLGFRFVLFAGADEYQGY